MSKNCIRLSALPLLAVQHVMALLDPQQVVFLSLISRKLQHYAAYRKSAAEDVLLLIPELYRRYPSFQIKLRFSETNLHFRPEENIESGQKLLVNGEWIPSKVNNYIIGFQCEKTEQETTKAFKNLVRHLLNVLKFKIIRMETSIFFLNEPMFKSMQFSNLTLTSQTISEQEARFIFENLHVRELVLRNCSVEKDNGLLTIPLKYPKIQLTESDWLSFDSFLTMRCVSFHVEKIMDNVALEQLAQFVSFWVSECLERLEYFCVGLQHNNQLHGPGQDNKSMLLNLIRPFPIEIDTAQDDHNITITRKKDRKRAVIRYTTRFVFEVQK